MLRVWRCVGRFGLALAAGMMIVCPRIAARAAEAAPPSLAQILAASPAGDWRMVDPANTIYMVLPHGRVIIELAPEFAPRYVAGIKDLAQVHFFDGLFVVRAQDNYVVQWGDAAAQRPPVFGGLRLKAEFDHPFAPGDPFIPLPDPDTYAPVTGFAGDFPAARDPATGLTWLVHCYGMVGAGRDVDPDSGGGAELYAVIGQAPRQLDRNVTLVGRVIWGMELLSTLPRGHGDLGFYQTREERVPIGRFQVGSSMQPHLRVPLQVLRTDSATFAQVIQNRRYRRDPWFKTAAGHIDVCNVLPPVREARGG
jgi:peptidylprolyl isomerase